MSSEAHVDQDDQSPALAPVTPTSASAAPVASAAEVEAEAEASPVPAAAAVSAAVTVTDDPIVAPAAAAAASDPTPAVTPTATVAAPAAAAAAPSTSSVSSPASSSSFSSASPDSSAVDHSDITIHHAHEVGIIECPSADSLGEPAYSGWLEKKGFKCGCFPSWKRRWMILQGGYIFKFEGTNSKKPTGLPIPVLDITAGVAPIDPKAKGGAHHAILHISTLRREYIFGSDSQDDLQN